jgi:hypothetical protein
MSRVILEEVWKLRTDPFYPEVDSAGAAIPPAALERSLDPTLDQRVVQLYFDIYDWSYSSLVGKISSQEVLEVFPERRTRQSDEAFMILMSGCRESGLNSLANLILQKIKLADHAIPLVVEVELEGREKARNVATVVKRTIAKLKLEWKNHPGLSEKVKHMEAEWESARKEEEGNKSATYSDLFQTFRDTLKPLTQPLVLKIISGGDNDSWLRIYNSVKRTFEYVIIMTGDLAYAKTCYTSMSTQSQNVAWIQALSLDSKKAHEFLKQRLSTGRVLGASLPATHTLMPFMASAIAALYEPGSAGPRNAVISHPVGWLRRTFYRALNDRLKTLAQAAAPLDTLDPDATLIGPAEIRQAREALNQRI